MKFFYLSSKANQNNQFEIHEKECGFIPDSLDRDYLGPFNNGREALRKALSIKATAVCCVSCCQLPSQPIFNATKSNSE